MKMIFGVIVDDDYQPTSAVFDVQRIVDHIRAKTKCEVCTFADQQEDLIPFGTGFAHRDCLVESGSLKKCGCLIDEHCDSCSGVDDAIQSK